MSSTPASDTFHPEGSTLLSSVWFWNLLTRLVLMLGLRSYCFLLIFSTSIDNMSYSAPPAPFATDIEPPAYFLLGRTDRKKRSSYTSLLSEAPFKRIRARRGSKVRTESSLREPAFISATQCFGRVHGSCRPFGRVTSSFHVTCLTCWPSLTPLHKRGMAKPGRRTVARPLRQPPLLRHPRQPRLARRRAEMSVRAPPPFGVGGSGHRHQIPSTLVLSSVDSVPSLGAGNWIVRKSQDGPEVQCMPPWLRPNGNADFRRAPGRNLRLAVAPSHPPG